MSFPRRALRVALAGFALIALCAANAYTGTVPGPERAKIKSIGIIAAIGDTCMFVRVRSGLLDAIRPPAASFLEISDWGLDERVSDLVTKILGKRLQVQTIAFEHQEFDTWTYAQLARHIRELPEPETPVDTYLLILREWRGDSIGGGASELAGLGLYRRDNGSVHRMGAFAAYRLVLLDADDGSLIATREAVTASGRLPWLAAERTLWPPTQNDLSPAQRAMLQADFVRLIDQSLPRALDELIPTSRP